MIFILCRDYPILRKLMTKKTKGIFEANMLFFQLSGHGTRRGPETVHGNTEKLARIWLHFI